MDTSAAARLLGLLSLFTSRPQWSATELAQRLGVTTRTVRRDITQLRDLGYPVESDAGRTGGYRLGPGGRLPPLLLTDDEAVAVAVGLRAVTAQGIGDDDHAAVAAMAKLEQVLPAVLRERVLALHGATQVVGGSGGPVADPEVLLTIAQGCRRSERLRFGYRDGGDATSERRAEPYGLVNAQRRWYVVAFDLDRDDWRTFRADRMHQVELTGHTFEPREVGDMEALVMSSIARYPWAFQAEILLDAPFELAVAEVPRTIGIIEPAGAGSRLSVGANDLEWIARYVASLPFDATIVSPDELRDEVRRLGERLVARAVSGREGR